MYCQATAITGMLMFGKISVGVRKIMTGLRTKMSTARTMKVYGRSSATRTIHIARTPYNPSANSSPGASASLDMLIAGSEHCSGRTRFSVDVSSR